MRNELKYGLISTAKRLACGLLRARMRIVRDTLLYALVIYGVGCIVPTPLDAQGPQTNYAPVLVSELADPPFGPFTFTSKTQQLEITIFVTDPDDNLPGNQDDFHARLFFYDPPTKTLLYPGNEEIMLGPAGGSDPTLRVGHFPPTAFCAFPGGGTGTSLLYVVAADRPFDGPESSTVVKGGLSDSNHWDLTCP